MLKPLATIVALSVFPTAAFSQEIFVPPVTTADPGYLFPNDRYQRERENLGGTSKKNSQPAQIELDAVAQARVRTAVQALVPEYKSRAQRDGETSANAWIRQRAFELGQQEAEIIKQRLGLD